MKKLISLVLALVLCVVAMPVMAFADTTSTDGLFGVIVDADGNIVERIPMSRATYVNSIHTLPAGGKFISYQYYAQEVFQFGFATRDMNGNYLPTSDVDIDINIGLSYRPGSDEVPDRWSTNHKAKVSEKGMGFVDFHAIQGFFEPQEPGYYFRGTLINNASTPAKIRIILIVDCNDSDIDVLRYI